MTGVQEWLLLKRIQKLQPLFPFYPANQRATITLFVRLTYPIELIARKTYPEIGLKGLLTKFRKLTCKLLYNTKHVLFKLPTLSNNH